MAKLGISTGTIPNDGTGDTLLSGAIKINSNFSEIYSAIGDGTNITNSIGYAKTAGIATYATSSGIATYATKAGVSTSVIGGIASVSTLSVSGVSTLGNTVIGGGTTQLVVNGDTRITGILTIGTSSITLNGSTNIVNVGSGVTIDGDAGTISLNGNTLSGAGVTSITAGSGISVDQSTGNVTITATGGGGGESYWTSTAAGIHTLSNVGVGTTNPTSALTVIGTANATSFTGSGTNLTGIVTSITAGSGISINQSTGNVTITATGGGGGESYWVSTAAGIHTLSNVGVGTTNPISKLTVGRYGVGTSFGTFAATAGIAHTADSFTISSTDFKTVEYTIHVGYESSIQAQKVLAMQNGSNAYSQEYAVMYQPDLLVSVGATVTSGEFRLVFTPEPGVNGIVTYRFTREAMI